MGYREMIEPQIDKEVHELFELFIQELLDEGVDVSYYPVGARIVQKKFEDKVKEMIIEAI